MGKITILGSGSPIATATRHGSSQTVHVGNEVLMFDCGPATVYRLPRAGIDPREVGNLFFTHHHFDHDSDYALMLLSRWNQGLGKIEDINVYGPTNTEEITERLIGENGAFAFDWNARVHHRLSHKHYEDRGGVMPRTPPSAVVKDIQPGAVITGENWEVTTAEGDHVQPFLDSLAYRVDTDDGSVVVTGDTGPCESVETLAHEADYMIAMCGGFQESQRIGGTDFGQMGTTYAGELAQRAGVKNLVISHVGDGFGPGGNMEKGIVEISRVFDGNIIYATELMSIPIQGDA